MTVSPIALKIGTTTLQHHVQGNRLNTGHGNTLLLYMAITICLLGAMGLEKRACANISKINATTFMDIFFFFFFLLHRMCCYVQP